MRFSTKNQKTFLSHSSNQNSLTFRRQFLLSRFLSFKNSSQNQFYSHFHSYHQKNYFHSHSIRRRRNFHFRRFHRNQKMIFSTSFSQTRKKSIHLKKIVNSVTQARKSCINDCLYTVYEILHYRYMTTKYIEKSDVSVIIRVRTTIRFESSFYS